MKKPLISLLLVLISGVAVPETRSLTDHLAAAARAPQARLIVSGNFLHMDEALPADDDHQPSPIKVALTGLTAVCFVVSRRRV